LSFKLPEYSGFISAVLDIHKKKVTQRMVNFLTLQESEALLAAINQNTRIGRRDHTLILLAIDTGLRLSELINLKWSDVNWITRSIQCVGKGRKEREIFLSNQVYERLCLWHDEVEIEKNRMIFPTIYGVMSSDTFQYLVKKYARIAAINCPSIGSKIITPHTLRHTAIMRALHSGVELAKIALWVGHESMRTTYGYLSADSKMKEEILKKIQPLDAKVKRYKPDSDIIAYLKRFDRSKTDKRRNENK
jgi:integrase